jgi:hypothetical protein
MKGEADIGHTTSRDIHHAFPTGSDSQTRSRAIYGNIQFPIDLSDSPETKLMNTKMYASREMESNGLMALESDIEAEYDATQSNNLV